MDSKHFSRRTAMVGGAGVAAAALTYQQHLARANAQDASPEATPGVTVMPGGVEVDPQMQEVLDALASFDAPALADVTPQVGRELPSFADAVQQVLADKGEPGQEAVGDIRHVLIPGPADVQLVARLFYPVDAPSGLLPVAVYFHGGGFVIANITTYEASCRAIANAAGCIVASVAYRQAPENPFPTAVDDAYTATQFFLSTAGEIGGDPEKVAVVGESAGGNLATVVCQTAKAAGDPMPIHQVLVYPVATFAPTGEAAESVETFADAMPLNAAALEWFGSYYLSDPVQAEETAVSPLNAEDLADLPPATIILAEIDPLQSQGMVYGQALEDAGVDVTVTLYEGVTHEFFGMGALVDKASEAVAEVATRLKESFGTS